MGSPDDHPGSDSHGLGWAGFAGTVNQPFKLNILCRDRHRSMSDTKLTTERYAGFETPRASLPRQPVLVVVHHADSELLGQRYELRPGEILSLGRTSRCLGGALDQSLVSRQHLEVRHDSVGLTARDLDSSNGTFVNGVAITERSLAAGDVITLGGVLLLVQWDVVGHRPKHHPTLLGTSSGIARVIERVAVAAARDVTVLIRGETGVGKELVARALHHESGRGGRFVAINCSAISDGVLQSELFGHVRGAFSGATEPREGLVRAAQGGTLLFDEIGDASASLQASLLRLLEQREYRALGSDRPRTTDARFVAATHVQLDTAVAAERFRQDLYGRLNRWVIEVPPLRERTEDVMCLARHFARAQPGAPRAMSRELALALLRHDWPHNVRELQTVMQRVALESSGSQLVLTGELAAELQGDRPQPGLPAAAGMDRDAPAARVPVRRPPADVLLARFLALGCNATALAHELGIGRTTLYRWCRELEVDLKVARRQWETSG